MTDTHTPTTPTSMTVHHRATRWDRTAIIVLGTAGCALSYDALRQMATAVHVRPQLTYLFPVVIDGFIAYGVRALLVLRQAPLPARLYAWTLFITATAASIWANGLHALDLNHPGTRVLHLDDATVTALSAVAPLALAGATHLHILITRHGTTPIQAPTAAPATTTPPRVQDGTQPAARQSPAVPYTVPAPNQPQVPGPESSGPDEAATASGNTGDASATPTEPGHAHRTAGEAKGPEAEPQPKAQSAQEGSSPAPGGRTGGRPAMASIEELADVIETALQPGSVPTRESARKAVSDAGLGAGTVRLSKAMTLVRQRTQARPHPTD